MLFEKIANLVFLNAGNRNFLCDVRFFGKDAGLVYSPLIIA